MPWDEGVDFLLHMLGVLHRCWPDLHPGVRERFLTNFVGYEIIEGDRKRRAAFRHLGDYPCIMVVSPTMRCNLGCDGCYSASYDHRGEITTERLDRLYTECEELGIHFVVVTGGEPYLRSDTLELFEKHPTLYFMTFTNGTIIADRGLAPDLARLGNVLPCVSVEGFEAETDERRGSGTYAKVLEAMRAMRAAGVLFGYSATPMRHNNDLLVSDRFIDHYAGLGCKVGWYFSYMPIGRAPDLGLMPTPEQRLHRYRRVREIRASRDLIAADFFCDGMLTGGCLSGGRLYFHVSSRGAVEPCVFHQFHVDSINEKPLRECLSSPYLRDLRARLRDVENPLRPCPVIDNPEMLRQLVSEHGPRPSQPDASSILTGELARGIDEYAARLKAVFDPVFDRVREGFVWPLEAPAPLEVQKARWAARKKSPSIRAA
jgi:MoaA/NifB/PqqE/SkfB family radical SAM enzyme